MSCSSFQDVPIFVLNVLNQFIMKTLCQYKDYQTLAVCYYRVSRNIQNDLRQENDVRDYCKNNSITIVETFREKISGTKRLLKQGRPELEKCINYLNDEHINLLVCSELSRLGRTPEVVHIVDQLTQKKICVISLKENIKTLDEFLAPIADQLLLVNIINGIALKEADTLSYRIKSGKRTAVLSKGAWTGGKFLPYGYSSVDGKLTINSIEAEITKDIFYKYLSGWGSVKLANWLNMNNIPTKLGNKWGASTINKILSHEIYTGKRSFNNDIVFVPGLRIIEEDILIAVQKRMIENKKIHFDFNKTKKYDVLFDKGLIRCGICGKPYTGIHTKDVYICTSSKYSKGCGNSRIKMNQAEQAIQIVLAEKYDRLIRSTPDKEEKNKLHEAELRLLEQQHIKEQIKQARYNEMYAESRLKRIDYDKKYNASLEQIVRIQDNIVLLKEKIRIDEIRESSWIIKGEIELNMKTGKSEHIKAYINKNILHRIIRQIIVKRKEDKQEIEVQLINDESFIRLL